MFLEVSLLHGHLKEVPGWGILGGGWDLSGKKIQEEKPHLGKIMPFVKEEECPGGALPQGIGTDC